MTGIKPYSEMNFKRSVSIAPLVTFRIIFGLLMCFSLIRFWWRGWIDAVYILPKFHFSYWGFEWIQTLGSPAMYILFAIIIISTVFITFGLFYRIASIIFFLGFSYVELIDVTTYLNHYYFISLIAFLMIWLPANRYFSIDVWLNPRLMRTNVPLWTIGVLRLQLAIVYVFAGLAKLNPDWMLQALPMKIWLPAKTHLPLVGNLMYEEWVAYLFSWFGAFYDLFIVFFLLNKKTRPVAYFIVLIFHISTAIFFPGIGMFPYVMILSSTLFFSSGWHEQLLKRFSNTRMNTVPAIYTSKKWIAGLTGGILIFHFLIQFLMPLRFIAYPGNLFWTEQGYRFSWRVMLMEKSGNAFFYIKDSKSNKTTEVNNAEFLTPLQEKMMCTQPDMVLRYAHFLAKTYRNRGFAKPEVYAEDYVALNGRQSKLFINPKVNLALEKLSWKPYTWVLPSN
ncbi:MAG: HTTM domain-containing protein [Bacteroidota bacterium]